MDEGHTHERKFTNNVGLNKKTKIKVLSFFLSTHINNAILTKNKHELHIPHCNELREE